MGKEKIAKNKHNSDPNSTNPNPTPTIDKAPEQKELNSFINIYYLTAFQWPKIPCWCRLYRHFLYKKINAVSSYAVP